MTNIGRTTITDDIDVNSLRCHGDYVLIEVFEKTKTQGGLHIAGKGTGTECLIGKVISVGKELPNSYDGKGYPIGVEPGEIILTMQYIGDRVETSEGKYRFLHAHGIWAKVRLKDQDSFDIASLEPTFAFMLVRPKDDEVTKGGIILASGHDAEEKLRKATVLKVGEGQWDAKSGNRIPVPLEPKTDILMMRYAGAEVVVNGESLRLIDYADVKSALEA